MPRLSDFAYRKPISMTGSTKPQSIKLPYPYIVELIVPLKGFGYTLKKMQTWHQARGLMLHQRSGGYVEPHWYSHWCFADPQDAKEFQATFGGEVVRPST